MKSIELNRLNRNIEEIALYDLREHNTFGSAYYVSQQGKIVYQKCFGKVTPNGCLAVNENTIFRMASMTKPVTAVAILILVDRGMLSLDTPVKKFLPQFENIHITATDGTIIGISKTDMTILHLLTHTSGIGDSKTSQMCAEDKKSVENSVNFYAKAGLDFEPFTKQVYSGTAAFDVLVATAEKVTGMSFEEFLQREIFKPCHMKDTTFSPTAEQISRIIAMHDKQNEKGVVGKVVDGCIFEDYPIGHNLGGAGLISTLSDYSSFVNMLLYKGKIDGKQIVTEKTMQLLSEPFVRKEVLPGNYNRGLGVRVVTENEKSILPIGSFGWSGAYGTHFWVDPINCTAGIYMKNSRVDGGSFSQSAQRFEEAVYNSFI